MHLRTGYTSGGRSPDVAGEQPRGGPSASAGPSVRWIAPGGISVKQVFDSCSLRAWARGVATIVQGPRDGGIGHRTSNSLSII